MMDRTSSLLHVAESIKMIEKSVQELKVVFGRDETGARELALALTHLQEVRLWLNEAARVRRAAE